jgi:hypothetical protein
MREVLFGRGLCVVLITAAAGCAKAPASQRYEFLLRVESDPGRPLAGAVVRRGDKVIGTSKADGLLKLRADGSEGRVVNVVVECPAGFASPKSPVSVHLRRSSDKSRLPEYSVSCPPTSRAIVVAVRAERGPHLPVRYLGQELARTDENGAAHVLLHAAPHEEVQLSLDTSDNPRLRPQHPTVRFRTGSTDDVVVFDHEFSEAAQPRPAARRRSAQSSKAAAAARGPVRIVAR